MSLIKSAFPMGARVKVKDWVGTHSGKTGVIVDRWIYNGGSGYMDAIQDAPFTLDSVVEFSNGERSHFIDDELELTEGKNTYEVG